MTADPWPEGTAYESRSDSEFSNGTSARRAVNRGRYAALRQPCWFGIGFRLPETQNHTCWLPCLLARLAAWLWLGLYDFSLLLSLTSSQNKTPMRTSSNPNKDDSAGSFVWRGLIACVIFCTFPKQGVDCNTHREKRAANSGGAVRAGRVGSHITTGLMLLRK